MTTDRPWAGLPNARHIDAVLADVKARPEVWCESWAEAHEVKNIARRANNDALMATYRLSYWSLIRAAVCDSVRSIVWIPAWDVIRTLIAWDDSADLLDLPADTLRTMSDLAPEPVCHQAALLLPWAIVREAT